MHYNLVTGLKYNEKHSKNLDTKQICPPSIHLNSHTEKWTLALSYNSSWAALGKRGEKPLTFIRKKTSIRVTLRQGAHLPRLVGGKEAWRENLC